MTTITLEFRICSANLNEEGPPKAKVPFMVFPRLSYLLSIFPAIGKYVVRNVLRSNLLVSKCQQVSHTSLGQCQIDLQLDDELEDAIL